MSARRVVFVGFEILEDLVRARVVGEQGVTVRVQECAFAVYLVTIF